MYFATNNAFSILDWDRQFGAPELRQRADAAAEVRDIAERRAAAAVEHEALQARQRADAAAEVRDVADCLVGGELPASAFRPKSSTRQLQTSRS